MKKIMFNDRYGLTQAVLDGRKTMTRRIVSESLWDKWTEYDDLCGSVGVAGLAEIGVSVTREYSKCEKFFLDHAPFKIGEIVAIAQSYKDGGYHPTSLDRSPKDWRIVRGTLGQSKGWNNKMFVRADACKTQIRITNVRVERLQDISDEDCIKEGVVKVVHKIPTEAPQYVTKYYPCQYFKECADKVGWGMTYHTPQKAFAVLIDKVSGKGTWESNPFVFVYEFELVK